MKVLVRNVPALPTEGFVRLSQVLQVVPVGKTSWYAGLKSDPPKYPRPVKLGPRISAYRVEDIRALIEHIGAGGAAQ